MSDHHSPHPPADKPTPAYAFVPRTSHPHVYEDGTVVPSLDYTVTFMGKKVGNANIHLHKITGKDKVPDVSFGFTGNIDAVRMNAVLHEFGFI